jgi:hypothetical protein
MVHYGPKLNAAQLPPPTCPKCGSHRTEIVGRSNDSKTIVVRCNTCGERTPVSSEVSAKILDNSRFEAAS